MSHQEPPRAEAVAQKRTKSFICELPLRVTPAEERVLLVRLEAARQVCNACLGEGKRRVGLVRQSKAFLGARALYCLELGIEELGWPFLYTAEMLISSTAQAHWRKR